MCVLIAHKLEWPCKPIRCEANELPALPLPPRRLHASFIRFAKPMPPQVFAGEDSLTGAERTRSGSAGAAPSAGNSASGLNPHAHHLHHGHHGSHAHDGSGAGSKPNSAAPGAGRTRAASLRRMDSGGSTSSGYSTPVGGTSMSGQRGGAGRGPLGFDLWTNDPWELVDRFRPGIMPQTDRIQVGRGLTAAQRAYPSLWGRRLIATRDGMSVGAAAFWLGAALASLQNYKSARETLGPCCRADKRYRYALLVQRTYFLGADILAAPQHHKRPRTQRPANNGHYQALT